MRELAGEHDPERAIEVIEDPTAPPKDAELMKKFWRLRLPTAKKPTTASLSDAILNHRTDVSERRKLP